MSEVCRNRSYAEINLGSVLHSLNNQQKTFVRQIEKLLKRQVQSKYGILFNEIYTYQYIYIYIYIYIYGYFGRSSSFMQHLLKRMPSDAGITFSFIFSTFLIRLLTDGLKMNIRFP